MDIKKTIELIEFFNKISVDIKDVTNPQELQDGRKVVEAIYAYEDKTFTTKKLYYKDISLMDNVKNPEDIKTYFGSSVFWLDHEKHNWPTNQNLDEKLTEIISDITDELEFQEFLNNIYAKIKDFFNQENRSQQKNKELVYQQNNNHVHDIVLLLKAFIDSKGNDIKNHYFSKIVYFWYNDERTELRNDRQLVINLKNIIKTTFKEIDKMKEFQNYLKLLEHKHQIILQGPPGTGKTRLAKDIAYNLITGKNLSMDKDQRDKELKELESSEQYKLIQFHPAYSYEDFVRGIVAKSNDDGNIEYIVENKVLGTFAKKSFDNLIASSKETKELSEESWINEKFELFLKDMIKELAESEKVPLTKNIYLFEAQEGYFRYKGDNWNQKGSRINFNSFKDLIKENLLHHNSPDAFTVDKNNSHANYRYSYYFPLLELFFKKSGSYQSKQIQTEERKNYILVIDEINRANLPSVLGELIYALEYRGKEVESMYTLDDSNSNKLILPKNLYIIGTMNTADRSVGHIDYAIRRRFAFVNVEPSSDPIDEVLLTKPVLKDKAKNLYLKISNLFTETESNQKDKKYLSSDFSEKDVQLGHSYFLANSEEELILKLEYEIKPILREYLKDGILSENAKQVIEGLNV